MLSLIISLLLGIETPPEISLDDRQKVRATCYLPTGNKTADGTEPYFGICASNRDHLGDICLVWTMEGEWIGYFECRDVGGHKMLRNGTAIDIFQPDMESAKEWIATYGDYVNIIWIECEG